MSITDMHNSERCQHTHLSGRPCHAPARRGAKWCLFHAAEHNVAPLPFSTLDDAAGIHAAAGQVLFDLQRDIIDLRRASLMFSGLRLMRSNLKQLGVELGDPQPEPRRRTKQDEEDARLADLPSLEEELISRFNALAPEIAREEGLDSPPLMSYEAFQASGLELGEYFLQHLGALEPGESEVPPDAPSADFAAPDAHV